MATEPVSLISQSMLSVGNPATFEISSQRPPREGQIPGTGTLINHRSASETLDVNRNRLSDGPMPGTGTLINHHSASETLDVNRKDVNRNRLSDEPMPGTGTLINHHSASETLDVNRNRLSDEPMPGTGTLINHRSIKVAFVGMGPVALWSALQLKARNANAQIEMFEKRTEYVRNHTVSIDDGCFRSINRYENPILIEGLNQLREKILKEQGQISCKEFEADLRAIAGKMGITMHHGDQYEVVSIGDGKITFKAGEAAFDALVCADGAHSKGRKALLKMTENPDYLKEGLHFSDLSSKDEKTEFQTHRDLQYRVRVKYQVKGHTEKLANGWFNFIRYAYATFKAMLSPVDERIRTLSDDKKEVTIDFFISKAEYKTLKGFNLSRSAKLSNTKLAPSLKEKIETWLAIKNNFCQEAVVVGSEEITPYTLSSFHARQVHHVTASGKLICIAGDAATSLPYFRSLNNYLVVGADLGRKLGSSPHESLAKTGRDYEKYAGRRARWEGLKARFKNFMVNVLNLYLWLSNYAPWQMNFWSQQKLEGMRKEIFERTVFQQPSTTTLVA